MNSNLFQIIEKINKEEKKVLESIYKKEITEKHLDPKNRLKCFGKIKSFIVTRDKYEKETSSWKEILKPEEISKLVSECSSVEDFKQKANKQAMIKRDKIINNYLKLLECLQCKYLQCCVLLG